MFIFQNICNFIQNLVRLIWSQHVNFNQDEEENNRDYDDVSHVLPQIELQFEVLGTLLHRSTILTQTLTHLSQLIQILISIQKHLKRFTHYVFDVDQFLIQLINILLGTLVEVFLPFFVDDSFKSKEFIWCFNSFYLTLIINCSRSSISCLQLLLKCLLDILQEAEGKLLGIGCFRQRKIYDAILNLIMKFVPLSINCTHYFFSDAGVLWAWETFN